MKRERKPSGWSVGLRPEDQVRPCAWDGCSNNCTLLMPLTFCDDHITLIVGMVVEHENKRWDVQPLRVAASQVPESKPGWIYYIQVGERIKVGYTANLRRRFGQYPPGSVLLAAHPGRKADETVLHSMLTLSRSEGREWYALTDEMAGHIRGVIAKHGDPPAVKEWTTPHRAHAMQSRGAPRKIG